MNKILLLALVMFLSACSTSNSGFSKPDLSKISVGMTKSEVISTLGKPDDVASDGDVEFLEYGWDSPWDGKVGFAETYIVRLRDGRVDLTGRKGDFGTVANHAVDINVREKIDSRAVVSSEHADEDLYLKLKKLQELREEKVITEEEFQKLKSDAIAKAK